MESRPNTSFVTGGAGFIGAHVVNELIEGMGHRVIVLDDLSGGSRENLHREAIFVQGSITDQEAVNALFESYDIDYIYHLAAYAAEGLSHFIKRFNYTNNLIGSVNLINAAIRKEVRCFVFTSSIAVYGANQLPMKEDMTPMPEDPYGIAKLAVEQDLSTSLDMFGLDHIVFRPHNVFGEYQNIGDKYRNVVGIFMNQLMQGKELTVFGDGEQTRAFSYIGDVAPYIARSVEYKEAYNELFNVGGDQEFTVNQLAKAVMKAMGAEGELKHLLPRNEVEHAYADHSKMKKVFEIDESYFTPLQEGLTRMAEWALKVGVKESQHFSNIEVEKNLPPVWSKGS